MLKSSQFAGLLCMAIGLYSGAYLIWTQLRQRAADRWQSTTAKILQSDLDEDSDGWFPKIKYEYSVQGRIYTSERLYFFVSNGDRKGVALRGLAPYPIGKTVIAYYDPANPADSVLDRHVPLWRTVFWLCFTAFLLFASANLWMADE
jgi:hypothetical protein